MEGGNKALGLIYFLYISSVIMIGIFAGMLVGAFMGPKMLLESFNPFKGKSSSGNGTGLTIDEDPFQF